MEHELVPGQDPERARPGFWIRAAARSLDLALVAIVDVVLLSVACLILARPGTPGLLLPVFYLMFPAWLLVYLAYCHTRSGQTWGKALLGLRVCTAWGNVVPRGRAITRAAVDAGALLLAGLCLFGLVDYLWVAFSRQRRALHDIVAGTEVCFVRPTRRVRWVATGLAGLVLFVGTMRMAGTYVVLVGPHMSDVMAPTIRTGDLVYGNRLTYRLRPPTLGDIVRFQPPADQGTAGRHFVMRIVGLPGDRVAVRGGKLWRNGAAVPEPYLREPMPYNWPEGGGTVLVPRGNVVVLGDNRNNANDSHRWCTYRDDRELPAPFLPLENIRARVVAIGWPPHRVRDLNHSEQR